MEDFDPWGADGGDTQGAASTPARGRSDGAPVIDGGLLDPRTFPARFDGSGTPEDEWIERPALSIRRPLDTDIHTEVLRDILNAQAKLPPARPPQDGVMIFGGRKYIVLQAETFDPARSNGVTAMPSNEMVDAGIAGAPTVAVSYGPEEKMAYIIPFPVVPTSADIDPQTGLASALRMKPTVFMPSGPAAATGASVAGNTARGRPPANALAVGHGHIDDGPPDPFGQSPRSDGMVDSPGDNGGYGDTDSLRLSNPIPTATVSNGRVGWHGIDDGRLKFVYPPGAMTPEQVQQMHKNLNREQNLFLRSK
ncbi:MAG: hypothetical protein ACXU82_04750 [Caulobacteraceae bacterium]